MGQRTFARAHCWTRGHCWLVTVHSYLLVGRAGRIPVAPSLLPASRIEGQSLPWGRRVSPFTAAVGNWPIEMIVRPRPTSNTKLSSKGLEASYLPPIPARCRAFRENGSQYHSMKVNVPALVAFPSAGSALLPVPRPGNAHAPSSTGAPTAAPTSARLVRFRLPFISLLIYHCMFGTVASHSFVSCLPLPIFSPLLGPRFRARSSGTSSKG